MFCSDLEEIMSVEEVLPIDEDAHDEPMLASTCWTERLTYARGGIAIVGVIIGIIRKAHEFLICTKLEASCISWRRLRSGAPKLWRLEVCQPSEWKSELVVDRVGY